MTIAFEGIGSEGADYPSGIVAGEKLVLYAVAINSPYGGSPTYVDTPSGWDLVGITDDEPSGGYGAFSITVTASIFERIADGSETGAVPLTGGGFGNGGVIARYSTTGAWDTSTFAKGRFANNSSISATLDTNPGLAAGDLASVLAFNCDFGGTYSAQAITATGITLGTEIERYESSGGMVSEHPVASGNSSAAPVYTATGSGTTPGAIALIRLRESVSTDYDRDNPEDVPAPTDAVTHAGVFARSMSENVSIVTLANTRATTTARSIAETKTAPTDANTRSNSLARAIAESMSAVTDAVARSAAYARSIAPTAVFDPASVSGMLYRYEASQAVVSSGVSSIPNTGTVGAGAGNANNLSFVVAKPTYVAADTRFNNKPSVYHNVNSGFQTGTLTDPIDQPSTFYAMVNCVDNDDAGMVWIRAATSGSTSPSALLQYNPATNTVYWGDGNPSFCYKVTTALYGKHLVGVVQDGANTKLYIDDMTTPIAGYTGSGGTANVTTLRVGAWTGVVPDMAWTEQIMYEGAHDAATRTNIASYFTAMYTGQPLAAPTDAVTRVVTYARAISETKAAPIDANTRVTAAARALAESIAIPTDANTRMLAEMRAIAESIAKPTDANTGLKIVVRSQAESVSTPTDAVTRLAAYVRALADSISAPTDVNARQATHARVIADSVSAPTDASSRTTTVTRAISESIGAATDAVTRLASYVRGTTDSTPAPVDSVDSGVGRVRAMFESIAAPLDDVARTLSQARSGTENAGAVSDAFTRLAGYVRGLAESLAAPTDANAHVLGYARGMNESIAAATDAVTRAITAIREQAEALAIPVDVIARGAGYVRSVVDSLASPTDVIARIVVLARNASENVAQPVDQNTRHQDYGRSTVESVSLPADGVQRVTSIGRSLQEQPGAPVDTIGRLLVLARGLLESIAKPTDANSYVRIPFHAAAACYISIEPLVVVSISIEPLVVGGVSVEALTAVGVSTDEGA